MKSCVPGSAEHCTRREDLRRAVVELVEADGDVESAGLDLDRAVDVRMQVVPDGLSERAAAAHGGLGPAAAGGLGREEIRLRGRLRRVDGRLDLLAGQARVGPVDGRRLQVVVVDRDHGERGGRSRQRDEGGERSEQQRVLDMSAISRDAVAQQLEGGGSRNQARLGPAHRRDGPPVGPGVVRARPLPPGAGSRSRCRRWRRRPRRWPRRPSSERAVRAPAWRARPGRAPPRRPRRPGRSTSPRAPGRGGRPPRAGRGRPARPTGPSRRACSA